VKDINVMQQSCTSYTYTANVINNDMQ